MFTQSAGDRGVGGHAARFGRVTHEGGSTGFGLARVFAQTRIHSGAPEAQGRGTTLPDPARRVLVASLRLMQLPEGRVRIDRRASRPLARLLHIVRSRASRSQPWFRRIPGTWSEGRPRPNSSPGRHTRANQRQTQHRLSGRLVRQGIVHDGGRSGPVSMARTCCRDLPAHLGRMHRQRFSRRSTPIVTTSARPPRASIMNCQCIVREIARRRPGSGWPLRVGAGSVRQGPVSAPRRPRPFRCEMTWMTDDDARTRRPAQDAGRLQLLEPRRQNVANGSMSLPGQNGAHSS
jgi:hypothetical protein